MIKKRYTTAYMQVFDTTGGCGDGGGGPVYCATGTNKNAIAYIYSISPKNNINTPESYVVYVYNVKEKSHTIFETDSIEREYCGSNKRYDVYGESRKKLHN